MSWQEVSACYIIINILCDFKKKLILINITLINLKQVERITCKNECGFVIDASVLKRCRYTLSVELFLGDFHFNWRWTKAKVLFRKTSGIHTCCLENSFVKVFFLFDVSWKLIRWNEINLLSCKIQICGFNAVCMLLEYLFCFKVADQMKCWINESLITLDIEQWILILKSNVSLECIKCFKVFYCG